MNNQTKNADFGSLAYNAYKKGTGFVSFFVRFSDYPESGIVQTLRHEYTPVLINRR